MGESTQLTPNILNRRRDRVSTGMLVDIPLLLAIFVLVVFGLLMLYSASWNYSLQAYDNGMQIFLHQLTMILIGTAGAVFLFLMDYHHLKFFAPWAMGAVLLALIFMLIDPLNPSAATGYTRSLTSGGSVQPSEFAKIIIVVFMAEYLANRQDQMGDWVHGIAAPMGILLLVILLVMLQPDFSAGATIAALGILIYVVAGGNMKYVLIMGFGAFAMLLGAYFLFDKVSVRFADYFAGLTHPEDASYHIRRAYNAILNGGIFGVGIGKSSSKITGLPVAWTDSIFAVILEETGLVGGFFVISLYTFILWRGYEISKKAPDAFGKLLAAGISIWIFMEAAINICVMLNILPFAGNALPLISSGGSSAVCTLAGFGILLNISRVSAIKNFEKGKSEPDAIIDMRRGNWGWRVSRPGSSSVKNE